MFTVIATLLVQDSLDDYYKFPVGTSWSYVRTGDVTGTIESTVSKIEEETIHVASKERTDGTDRIRDTQAIWYVANGCLCWEEIPPKKVQIAFQFMKAGAKIGDSWKMKFGDGQATFTHQGEVELKVEAGTYKAVHVHGETPAGLVDIYFAAKVGMIKLTFTYGERTRTVELKEMKAK